MSQWWHLPTEVVDLVLKQVSFLDYVALTQTNASLRELLNNTRVLELVLSANFAQKIDSFEWSFSDIDKCLQKNNLWKSYCELDRFLLSVDYPLIDSISLPSAQLFLLQNIYRFTTNETYFIPIIIIYEELIEHLRELSVKQTPKILISRVSWARLLMHLQNFRKAIRFFEDTDDEIPLLIERAFFEVSRVDLNFPQLAKNRTIKLYHIRQQVRKFLPISKGSITFANWSAFFKFLKDLVLVIVRALPKPKSQSPALNILRAYEGDGTPGQEMIMSIVAKIMTEEVFKKFSIKVDNRLTKLSVRSSSLLIWVGPIEVRLTTDPVDVQMFARRVDPNSIQSPLAPLTIGQMLKNIDTSDQNLYPIICYELYWKPSNMRWKYFITLFEETLSNKPLSPCFGYKGDLLSFFYSSTILDKIGIASEEMVEFEFFSLLDVPKGNCSEKYQMGQIVTNPNLGYIGPVILVDEENKLYRLCPHDFTRISIAHESSLIPVEHKQEGDLIVNWLMQSEGFVFSGVFLFTFVELRDDKRIFLSN